MMNNRIKIRLFLTLLLLIVDYTLIPAQKKNKDISRADAYFYIGCYADAAKHYEFAYRKEKSEYISDKLIDCYLKLNEHDKAKIVFSRLNKQFSLSNKQKLKYSDILKHEGEIYKAKTELVQSLNSNLDLTTKHIYQWAIASCDSILAWQDYSSVYKVFNMEEINTSYSEISPVHYKDSMVFASNREHWKIQPKSFHDHQPYFDLYITSLNYQWEATRPRTLSENINSPYHESSASFNEKGDKMYFTQCSETGFENDSVKRMKLYASENTGDGWNKPHTFIFNDSTYSFAHPCVDKDNKMIFFVSDMKGGYGGTDIYVSIQVEDGVWSDPINLGPIINSSGNETYPFYHDDGVLYFASDYHIGMGGYDIFMATQKNGEWINVTNLKPPINSTYDDIGIYFSRDRSYGYFSSNRPGGKGAEDIYLIRKK